MREEQLIKMFMSLSMLVDLSVNYDISPTRRENAHLVAFRYKQMCLSYFANPIGDWFFRDKAQFESAFKAYYTGIDLYTPWKVYEAPVSSKVTVVKI